MTPLRGSVFMWKEVFVIYIVLTYNTYFDTYAFSFHETFKASQMSYQFKSVTILMKIEKKHIPQISPIGVRKLLLKIDRYYGVWAIKLPPARTLNKIVKTKQEGKCISWNHRLIHFFVSFSLFKSSFSPFLSSPILPPFSAGAHDTWNFQILVKLQVGSKYMLLYSVTVEGGGSIVLCFSKMRFKRFLMSWQWHLPFWSRGKQLSWNIFWV